LRFINFDIPKVTNQCSDGIDIYDGDSDAAPLKRSLCGSKLPSDIVSSGNTFFVYYHSSGNSSHFRMKYFVTTYGKPTLCSWSGVRSNSPIHD